MVLKWFHSWKKEVYVVYFPQIEAYNAVDLSVEVKSHNKNIHFRFDYQIQPQEQFLEKKSLVEEEKERE